MISHLKREPLVRFFIVSISLYLLYGFFGKKDSELLADENTIFITNNEIIKLDKSFQLLYNRSPYNEEKEEIINKYIRELVLYEEALKMGLDKDDVVIKRRMVLNLTRTAKSLINPEEPNIQELQTCFKEHKEKYRIDDIFNFTQLFFDPDKREKTTLDDAEKAINKLKTNNILPSDASNYGDKFALKRSYINLPPKKIARNFGIGFTESIITLEPYVWHGPILSGYGVHLVYITKKKIGGIPNFEDVKEKVTKDWMEDKNKELYELFIDNLISGYEIIIQETPASKIITEKE